MSHITYACRCRPLPLLPALIVIAALSALFWAALMAIVLLIWQAGLWGAPVVAAAAVWATARLWRTLP